MDANCPDGLWPSPPGLEVLLRDDSCTLDDLYAGVGHSWPEIGLSQDELLWPLEAAEGTAALWRVDTTELELPAGSPGFAQGLQSIAETNCPILGSGPWESSHGISAQAPRPYGPVESAGASTCVEPASGAEGFAAASEPNDQAAASAPEPRNGIRVRKRIREKERIAMLERLLKEKRAEAEELQRDNSKLRREARVLEAALLTSQDMVEIAQRVQGQVEHVEAESTRTSTQASGALCLVMGPRITAEAVKCLSVEQMRGMMTAVLKLATALLVDPSPENEAHMRKVMENGYHSLLHLFVLKPQVLYQVEACNYATGKLEFPDSTHAARVSQVLDLSHEQFMHLHACLSLYQRLFSDLMRQRRELAKSLPLTLQEAYPRENVTTKMLDNLRKEAFLYSMLVVSIVKTLTATQWAMVLVHSYPYQPAISAILAHAVQRHAATHNGAPV